MTSTYRERSAIAFLSLSLSAFVCADVYWTINSFWSAMFRSRIFCFADSNAFSEKMGETRELSEVCGTGEGIVTAWMDWTINETASSSRLAFACDSDGALTSLTVIAAMTDDEFSVLVVLGTVTPGVPAAEAVRDFRLFRTSRLKSSSFMAAAVSLLDGEPTGEASLLDVEGASITMASISDTGVAVPLLDPELRAAISSRCFAILSSTCLRFAKLGTFGAFLVARGSDGGGVGVERLERKVGVLVARAPMTEAGGTELAEGVRTDSFRATGMTCLRGVGDCKGTGVGGVDWMADASETRDGKGLTGRGGTGEAFVGSSGPEESECNDWTLLSWT